MKYKLRDWLIDPTLNLIRRGDEEHHLEPLTMNVLAHLLSHCGQVVSADELLEQFWSGRHAEPSMVTRCINQIRSALGDNARNPMYIETIRKRGYRTRGPVMRLDGLRAETFETTALAHPLTAIAVMPFDDLSPEPGQDWLADAMTEELIESLSRIPGLRVPLRLSTRLLKQQNADIETIGRRLDVESVVEGSIIRVGDRMTLVAHWIRVGDQQHLWSGRYERSLEDVLAIQKELAVGIAEAIREELGIHDTAAFLFEHRYQTSDVRAWELFRRGFDLAFTFDPEKMAEGRMLLQGALDRDPDYLAARALLAWSLFDDPDARIRGAKEVLESDPTNARAHLVLIDDSMTQWDFVTAERLWHRVVAAKRQDNSLTLLGYHVFSCTGRLEQTLEVARRGVRLDPLWNTQHYFLGLAELNLGNCDGAVEPLERAIALFHETGSKGIALFMMHMALAFAYHGVGRDEDARDTALLAYPQFADEIRSGWAAAGWVGMNQALADALLAGPETPWFRYIVEAMAVHLYARAGAREPVYEYLERLMASTRSVALRDRKAYRNVCFLAEAINADIDFAPYRGEPRFRALKRELDALIREAAGVSGHGG